jgi:hypothetical protein
MKADDRVAQEQRAERRNEGQATLAEVRPAEQSHCSDRREIGRMRHQTERGGNDDRGQKRDQAGVIGIHERLNSASARDLTAQLSRA